MRIRTVRTAVLGAVLACLAVPASSAVAEHGVARRWNEQLLSAIRRDLARPTIHARNLFHVSMAMWDAWAVYDPVANTFLNHERATAGDVLAARNETISFAAFRVLRARFTRSPGAATSLAQFDAEMTGLGYDKNFTSTTGDTPAALGNRIAAAVLAFGLADDSNEAGAYTNLHYFPINPPLVPPLPGNPTMIDPNRWQPLALSYFVDQSGNVILGGYPAALSPEWGQVTPFALPVEDLRIHARDGFGYWVYHDPGPPPLLNGVGEDAFKGGHEQVAIWSGQLDPADGVMWDISPASRGNTALPDPADYENYYDLLGGGDHGTGYPVNPITGEPYEPQVVPRGDFARSLAEFWADGPSSETPPGHWYTILNYVSDHPLFEKRFGGTGPILDDLEWEVKGYFALGGAMHDTAVAVWGTKGWYDTSRPVSAIRYMADRGQSSDPSGPSYDPEGIRLYPGHIELVTAASTALGQRHRHLLGHEGKIAVFAWRGPGYVINPVTDTAGAGWILAENWWPYQRPTFVSPPFPGYMSGHSAYSRAAAEVMTRLTGSEFFPGGLGEFHCPQDAYLVFEDGPSVEVVLQWARYYDAADQSAMSRIWGGIHPGFDDLPSRRVGSVVGIDAFEFAERMFNGQASSGAGDLRDLGDFQTLQNCFDPSAPNAGTACGIAFDADHDGDVDLEDCAMFQDALSGL